MYTYVFYLLFNPRCYWFGLFPYFFFITYAIGYEFLFYFFILPKSFLNSLIFCIVIFVSILLTSLILIISFFPVSLCFPYCFSRSWRCIDISFIWYISDFLMLAFIAMDFPFKAIFAVFHKFWYAVVSSSFFWRNLLFLFWCHLWPTVHSVVCSICRQLYFLDLLQFLIFWFLSFMVTKIHGVISTFGFAEACFLPSIWLILV